MKKARKRKMFIAIGMLLVFVGVLMIWFNISYSPLKRQFQNDIAGLLTENQLSVDNELFTEDDFLHLPTAIQKYIENCGYIGTPKMSHLQMEYHNVDFSQGRSGPTLTIDYTQYNFVNEPCRMALIDSSMFGIPFEGYDYYQNGTGGMKGMIAKAITLFDQRGADMDKACLVTFLAESLFAPTILLQDYITFEEINDFEVRAAITYGGQTLCDNYQISLNGIKYPTKFQAVWNYPDGDFVYFNGVVSEVSYGHEQ